MDPVERRPGCKARSVLSSETSFRIVRVLPVSLRHFALSFLLSLHVFLQGFLLFPGCFLRSAGLGLGAVAGARIDGNSTAQGQPSQDEEGSKPFHGSSGDQILA